MKTAPGRGSERLPLGRLQERFESADWARSVLEVDAVCTFKGIVP
jgi:hypothetical protein